MVLSVTDDVTDGFEDADVASVGEADIVDVIDMDGVGDWLAEAVELLIEYTVGDAEADHSVVVVGNGIVD